MKNKGQAAMEFLMTYGWAILAAIIVVGVLWYLIGNPANLAGTNFQLGAPLSANAVVFRAGIPINSITMEFRNGAGQQINVTSIVISNCATITPNVFMPQGNLTAFDFDCFPDLGAGNRFIGDVTVYYVTAQSSLTQQSTGTISGKVP